MQNIKAKILKYKSRFKTFYFFAAVLIFAFCFLNSQKASAAVLYSQTANQDVYEGQSFVVDWFLDTEKQPVNTLDLKINFSPEFLQGLEASTGSNSLVSLWIKTPAVDNQKGQIELVGGIPNGLSSDRIPIFHSVFLAKKSGTASINMDPASVVLLNDGLGTSTELKFKNELFNVYPKDFIPNQISSPSHPDQNAWYQNRNVVIKFIAKTGVDYSYSFSSNIDLIPDNQKHETPPQLQYSDRPDGIYYFKLNSKDGTPASPSTASRGGSDWKEAGVFRVQIDQAPPESFRPLIASDPSLFSGKPFVSFSTVDKTSGISHYTVKVGAFGKPIETQSPYKLYKPLVGDVVEIKAYDRAGNSITESVVWRGYLSVNEFKWLLILFGLLAIAVNLILRKKIRSSNETQ
jgi:hypothetical protein